MLWVMYTTLDYTSILPERTLNRNTQNCRYPVKLPDNSWGGTRVVRRHPGFHSLVALVLLDLTPRQFHLLYASIEDDWMSAYTMYARGRVRHWCTHRKSETHLALVTWSLMTSTTSSSSVKRFSIHEWAQSGPGNSGPTKGTNSTMYPRTPWRE